MSNMTKRDVTYGQIDKMKHTIGFKGQAVTGSKWRRYLPYRNYYAAGKSPDPELDELVELGLMKRYDGNYYSVTDEGKTFLSELLNVTILPDME